eukprot:8599172-Pyramimonas_sp.AAC.1
MEKSRAILDALTSLLGRSCGDLEGPQTAQRRPRARGSECLISTTLCDYTSSQTSCLRQVPPSWHSSTLGGDCSRGHGRPS